MAVGRQLENVIDLPASSIAKQFQGGVGVATQAPTVIEWTTPGDTEKPAKDVAGSVAAGANISQMDNIWKLIK